MEKKRRKIGCTAAVAKHSKCLVLDMVALSSNGVIITEKKKDFTIQSIIEQ